MPNIQPYLNDIMAAVYGEQVRGAIHDAIAEINNEVDASTSEALRTTVDALVSSSASMADDMYTYSSISDSSTENGYKLVGGAGLKTSNSSYKLVKYPVTAGNSIRIVVDDKFQFQSSATVPSSGSNNNLVGQVYGSCSGVIKVPTGATYVILSTLASSNIAAVYNAASDLDHIIGEQEIQNAVNNWLENHPEVTTNQFIDGNYNITRHTNEAGKSTFVYWRHIPADYEPRVAYSEDGVEYGAVLANSEGATCAINASRFTVSTSAFYGYFRANGVTVNENDLATASSNSRQILCYKAGHLMSEPVNTSTSALNNKNYDWALVGFEDVIVNGQPTERSTPGNEGSADYHPRSFIAQNYDGSYIIGCTDGRSARSQGFRLSDIYSFLISTGYNVSYAYSLDGGGSVTLVEKGHRVNSYIENENRAVKSVIYFKKPGAFYNDVLKSATSEIDNDYRSKNTDYQYRVGDIYSYTHDSSATKQIEFRSLDTFEELGFLRMQANRFYVGVNNGFSHDGSANLLLDAGRTYFSWGGASRYLPRLVNSDVDYTDTIPTISSTGIYRIKITTSEVATSLGLSAYDYGDSIYITFRTNANFEILLTRSNIWYRWAKGTWKQVQFVTNS